jgi:hypothetical protein
MEPPSEAARNGLLLGEEKVPLVERKEVAGRRSGRDKERINTILN